jgi:hypothetical protein
MLGTLVVDVDLKMEQFDDIISSFPLVDDQRVCQVPCLSSITRLTTIIYQR